MASTYITLHTESGHAFRWTDDYDGASIVDLQSFLRQIHEAAASIEGELMKRQPERLSTIPGEVGKCCKRLHNTARELDVRERLDSKAMKHANDAVDILLTSRTNVQSRPYQEFLYDILYHCGPSVTLLCAASFGRKKIIDLGKHGRISLLEYVRSIRRLLETPTLEELANEHKIPDPSSSCILPS
ncbi:uncharacterized protein MYCGRDRAFT_51599 [Zymoseptoria tritici IPO323]|uniref:Uncharacterized protein n=1 Tax=Zymoseptoria tritici (strain CBS 115943 / IPO323) TaxID=336722 RepID=F9XQS3_ZYMTI|nr:uncharacterized protein MYCGRDRAFT_51599 [Zymoseptoria tritici IPO323]EGP82407.1 hypothetical protein MYCGRDRAFT_51599 [Zymoseptoria tritici IPO323]